MHAAATLNAAGPRADVDDRVHDAFLVAMRRRGRDEPSGRIPWWLGLVITEPCEGPHRAGAAVRRPSRRGPPRRARRECRRSAAGAR